MKALVKSRGEEGLWLEDVPEPEIGPTDVLIAVEKTGICGTDLHIWSWDDWARKTIPIGLTIGHEFVGRIEAIGSHVAGLAVGMRVTAEGHLTCGHCRNCLAGRRHLCPNTLGIGVNRNGAFAEFIAMPAANVWPCDPDIPAEIFAIFDPLGNAEHVAGSFDLVGEDVLITGAGPIGAMAAAMARHAGARHVVVTDVNDYRLELAATLGATTIVNVGRESLKNVMTRLRMTEGFDVGFEMSGNAEAFSQMIDAMVHGGRIALLGIQPGKSATDWNQIVFKGLTLKGIYGREMFENWYKLTAMIQSGMNVAPVITHRLPYERYGEGFEIMRSGRSGKIVLEWS